MSGKQNEWGSRLGVIMAVAGSAVGLGNFLRFPGLAAQYGGGAFMIAYAISFLIIGLPIGWAEWAMGRHVGQLGYNSCPGAFAAILRRPWAKYVGIIGVIVPVIIYTYYVYIESWCLGYAVKYWTGGLDVAAAGGTGAFFEKFTGQGADGSAFSMQAALPWLIAVFAFNFWLIYRGISAGIEKMCNWGMPLLIVLAIVVLVRVLTLGTPDAGKPHDNVMNGLGYLWNPTKVLLVKNEPSGKPTVVRELVGEAAIAEGTAEAASSAGVMSIERRGVMTQLRNPRLWLAAAAQIFFSLSVGFGVIIVYASYMKRDDDVVLSGLTASSANEFCEVGLGGLITVPAAVAFLGVASVAGQGTFGLGFVVLPQVFEKMPLGAFFGGAFFFMLALAAVTSSISMLQPGIAFVEEALGVGRKVSVALLGFITACGTALVSYFTKSLKALDTLDFWVGTMLIFILATIQIIMFGWKWGVEKGLAEANRGATIRIPAWFGPIMKWVCPIFLLTIFAMTLMQDVFGFNLTERTFGEPSAYVTDLVGGGKEGSSAIARFSMAFVLLVAGFFALLCSRSVALGRAEKGLHSNPDKSPQP
jgi:neurotransmitter:Na+ symporter, NSS family